MDNIFLANPTYYQLKNHPHIIIPITYTLAVMRKNYIYTPLKNVCSSITCIYSELSSRIIPSNGLESAEGTYMRLSFAFRVSLLLFGYNAFGISIESRIPGVSEIIKIFYAFIEMNDNDCVW
jgi:hypothetical protein